MIRVGRGFAKIIGSEQGGCQGYMLVVPGSHFCDHPGVPLVFHSFGVPVCVSVGLLCQPVPHEREELLCNMWKPHAFIRKERESAQECQTGSMSE